MYWVASLCASTERAKARLWKHQYIDYGYEIPDNCMALLLGLTFCVISPLIAPIALALLPGQQHHWQIHPHLCLCRTLPEWWQGEALSCRFLRTHPQGFSPLRLSTAI